MRLHLYKIFNWKCADMIGNTLKRMRSIYGYKATNMSEMLDISKSYLSEIENEKKQPSLELLQKYANIFGVKLSSLILLSEKFDSAEKENRLQKFIQSAMMGLTVKMTDNRLLEEEYENA